MNSQTARLAHVRALCLKILTSSNTSQSDNLQGISTVYELTELLTPSLSRADQKLEDIQTKTVDLSRSTEWLQDVILNMTERALSDMRKLDASAHKIQESLQLPSFQLFRFFNSSGLLAQMSQKGYIALLIILLRFVVKFARLLFSQSLVSTFIYFRGRYSLGSNTEHFIGNSLGDPLLCDLYTQISSK